MSAIDGQRVGDAPESGFRSAVTAFDCDVDRMFEPMRGRAPVDSAAKVVTVLGDHGWVWTAIAVWRARRSGPARRRAVRSLGLAGVSSTLVNACTKWVVNRPRPDASGRGISHTGVPVRVPTTSSFPSGHTLAAFCSAAALGRPGDRSGNALLYATAFLIGMSRIHLRAHHASDVAGGIVIGTVVGLLVRRIR